MARVRCLECKRERDADETYCECGAIACEWVREPLVRRTLDEMLTPRDVEWLKAIGISTGTTEDAEWPH